jgi:hypothetical protein
VKKSARQGAALTLTLLLAVFSVAQQAPTPQGSQNQNNDDSVASLSSSKATVSIPAGTRLALVLTQPIQTRNIHRGDDIYAQVTSPVTAGERVVVLPGTFVQGTVDKLTRNGGRGELALQSMSITFPDGYVAAVAGPMTLESDDGYALKDPGGARQAGAIGLAFGGLGVGALIGHSAANGSPQTITSSLPPGCTGPPPGCLSSSVTAPGNTAKGTAIGALVGGAIGAVASIALLVHSQNFFLDAGSPVRMVLRQPMTLPEGEVAAAVHDAEAHPADPQPVSPRPRPAIPSTDSSDPGTCYTLGIPGTPGIDIPGTPGVNGAPGTPPVHIPGTPATPPIPHPCP